MHSIGPNPRIEVGELKNIEAAFKRGKGIISLFGYFANWKVLAYAVATGRVGHVLSRRTRDTTNQALT